MNFLIDAAAPSTAVVAAGAGVIFLLVISALAFVTFRILRRTMKVAFRAAFLAAFLVGLLGGSIGLWWVGSSKPTLRPAPQRTR